MKSPWKWMKPPEPDGEYLVLASSIPPVSRSSTGRLFRGSSAVRKQLAGTEGVVGFSMLARPWRKQYATLSVWADDRALATFAGESPHRDLMSKRPYAFEWGERVRMRGGRGRLGQVTPPA